MRNLAEQSGARGTSRGETCAGSGKKPWSVHFDHRRPSAKNEKTWSTKKRRKPWQHRSRGLVEFRNVVGVPGGASPRDSGRPEFVALASPPWRVASGGLSSQHLPCKWQCLHFLRVGSEVSAMRCQLSHVCPSAAQSQSRRRFAQSLRRTRNVARTPRFIDLARVLKTILGTNHTQLQKRRAEVLEKLYKACLVGSDADFTCEHPLQHFGTACLLYLVSTGSIADICVRCPSSVLTGRDTTSWSCRRAVALYTTGLPRGHKAQSEKQNKLREAVGHLRTPNFRRILKSQRSCTDAAHVCSHVQTWPSSPGRPPHPLTQPGGRNGAVT